LAHPSVRHPGLLCQFLNQVIGLTPAMFGLGGSVFFLGYFLFEEPSNLILYREAYAYGASRDVN
jgi:fucose permease